MGSRQLLSPLNSYPIHLHEQLLYSPKSTFCTGPGHAEFDFGSFSRSLSSGCVDWIPSRSESEIKLTRCVPGQGSHRLDMAIY